MSVRTVIERGPKGKRSVAFSLDWPGWSRGAKTAELALETLEAYRDRYRPIAVLAGMAREFDAAGPLEIVEDQVGTGSTDFWGISFSPVGDRARIRWARPSSSAGSRAAGLLGVLRRRRGAGLAGDAQGSARRRARPRPDHPSHHPRRERGLREAGRSADTGGRGAHPGRPARSIGRHYVEAMRAYNAGEVNRPMRSWTCRFSSATPPSTHSTTRGRWRTRTCPARPDPSQLHDTCGNFGGIRTSVMQSRWV